MTTAANLPKYPNAFIGRTHHLRSLCSLLKQKGTRLVSLLGPGGMGKTRLAVEVGASMTEDFEHGVYFIPLDAVSDADLVPFYIGQHLGLKEGFDGLWKDKIIQLLADKEVLLILDNLEQLLASVTVIIQILDHCPAVKILVTSRETLSISYEIEYPLDSLNRPNPKLFPGPKDLLKFDAIDLFVQKAKATLPSFELQEDNALAVVKICQELDGLPLAIELAAARIRLFSPELILKKVENNFGFLKSRSKDVILRHQTIQNTVKWSYDLLDLQEKQLFQQVSMFGGGFSTAALEAISPGIDALDVIESFIHKSLIVKGKEVDQVSYFRMLKLIRDYGLEQLESNPQKEVYYQKFAMYFNAFVEKASAKLLRAVPIKWIALFEAEYDNLAIAQSWLISNQPEIAAKMGAKLWPFYLHRGLLREGLKMVEGLLNLTITNKSSITKLLEGAGTFSQNLGNYLAAKDYAKRCLDLCQELGEKIKIVKALNNLGWAEWRIGNYDQTVFYSEKALQISLELHSDHGKAESLNNLAWADLHQGRFEKMEQLQRQVLEIHQRNNNKGGIAFAKTNLGHALIHTGKVFEAEQLIEEAIQLFTSLKNQQLIAFAWLIKVEHLFHIKDYKEAKAILHKHCLPGFKEIGDSWGIATVHNRLGRIAWFEEEFGEAKFHLIRSLDLFRHSHDRFGEADSCLWLSKWCRVKGDFSSAENYLGQSLRLATDMGAIDLLKNGSIEKDKQAMQQKLLFPDLALKDPFLHQVRQVIEAHLGESDFSIQDLCQEIEISPSHLHRKLQELAGQSTSHFIRTIRLNKAKELLADPKITITAVAFDTGFKDPNYFYRVFKQTFQITPKEFRNRLRTEGL